MLDRMNPGTTPQKVTMGGLSAVVDIDTWETAGDINCSYQRGDYLWTGVTETIIPYFGVC
jgi:hypothetical protein